MNMFHTKFYQNRIMNPDFRILDGGEEGEISKLKKNYQLLDRISTFSLEMFIDIS